MIEYHLRFAKRYSFTRRCDFTKKAISGISSFCKKADMLLLGMCFITSIFGVIVIHSAALTLDPTRYVFVQLLSLVLGLVLFVVLTVVDTTIIADKWIWLCVFDVLFILILIPFGYDGGTGNRSWLRFGLIGIQPSEVVKVVFIVVLAKQISYLKDYKDLNSGTSILQLVIHFVVIFGLIVVVSSDLGSALIIFFIFLVMVFVSGISWTWIGLGFAAIAAFIPIAWTYILKDYQKQRILAPYDSSIDPTGDNISWQANQSKMALASGKLTGTGLGQGTQTQTNAISAKQTDFIFAVVGEELGMIACIAVMLMLTAIIIRCCIIGCRATNTFNAMLCFGVAAAIGFQTFINIGMCMGITPVIGITLPFISYGGSSTMTLYMAMGLVSGVKYRTQNRQINARYY